MDRCIVHLDLDSFFVSVERLLNSNLKNRPILVGGLSDRAVVASCSYEARRLGVHSAMPMRKARQLCPEAIVVQSHRDTYVQYSRTVTQIIEQEAPVVEKASIDEHYIDISGMDRFFGCWKWSQQLRRRIMKETGLPISLGMSVNKTVSKIATGQAKPCGELHIEEGSEKTFLAPLSIRTIPMVGDKTFQKLFQMGIHTIEALQQADPSLLVHSLGQNGLQLWQKANGIDNSPVLPNGEQKSISKEITFEKDTAQKETLRKVLFRMVDELAFELRSQQKMAGCLTLKIRYANFETHTRQMKLPYTASDKIFSLKAMELFRLLFNNRMQIRLIGLRLSDLINGCYQTDLFEDTAGDINLANTLDSIREKYGHHIIGRAFIFNYSPQK